MQIQIHTQLLSKKDIQKKHKSKSVGNKVIIKNASLKINKNLNINLITNNNSILINATDIK